MWRFDFPGSPQGSNLPFDVKLSFSPQGGSHGMPIWYVADSDEADHPFVYAHHAWAGKGEFRIQDLGVQRLVAATRILKQVLFRFSAIMLDIGVPFFSFWI